MANRRTSKISLTESEAPRLELTSEAPARIRTPKTSEIVADRIRDQIIRGDLGEGDTLPPEAQLMERFGVSRPTLREAFRILEAENLISVVRGSRSGAQVHKPRADVAARYLGYVLQAEQTTIGDLYAARFAIEPYVVENLCRRQDNDEAVRRLTEHVEQLKTVLKESPQASLGEGVSEFHRLLVEVSGNKTLALMNAVLMNLVSRHQQDFRSRFYRFTDADAKKLAAGVKSFERLVRLIASRETEAAVAHWRLHLKNANSVWTGAGEGERIVDALSGGRGG